MQLIDHLTTHLYSSSEYFIMHKYVLRGYILKKLLLKVTKAILNGLLRIEFKKYHGIRSYCLFYKIEGNNNRVCQDRE